MEAEIDMEAFIRSARLYLRKFIEKDRKKINELLKDIENGDCKTFFALSSLLGDVSEALGVCFALRKLGILDKDEELRELCKIAEENHRLA